MRLTILFLFITSFIKAQPGLQWTHSYNGTSHNGDRAAKAIYDLSGNVIVTGYTSNGCTGEDFCTVKYDANGQKLWSRTYTGFNNANDDEDRPTDIAVDKQGNIYVTGYSDSLFSRRYMSTIKYSPTGVELWSRRYKTNASYGTAITVDDSSNIYVAGYQTISFDEDMLLVKYNSAGVQLWAQTYSSGFGDEATDVIADNNGSVYLTGFVTVTGNGYDYATLKYTTGGSQQWIQTYNSPLGNYADRGLLIALDNAQNVIVSGTSRYFSTSNDDIVTLKYSPSGSLMYTTPWTGMPQVSDDFAKDLVTDNAGNAYVLGGSWQAGFALDFVVMQINSAGTITWNLVTDSLNDNNYPWALCIDSTYQNVYVASDFTHGPDPYTDRDWLLQKINTSGVEVARTTFDGYGNNFDIPFGIAINNNGDIAMTGVSAPSDYDTDLLTVKFNNQLMPLWDEYENGQSWVGDVGQDFYVDAAGNSYVCGSYNYYNYNDNVAVFKVNTSGQRVWTYEWEGPVIEGNERAKYLAVDANGNTYVAGIIDTTLNQNEQNIFLMKLSNTGQLVWRVFYAGSANGKDEPVGLRLRGDKLYLAGSTVNTGTGADGLALCYDTTGIQLWATSYDGGTQSEIFMAMELDQQQNLYAAGLVNPLSGALSDGLLVKFNSSGVVQWDSTYNNTSVANSRDFFNCIAIDGNNNAFVAGQSNQNWVTAKYTPAGIHEWTQNYSYSTRPDSVCAIIIDHDNNVIVGGTFDQPSEQDFGIIKYRNDSTQAWVKRYANTAGSDDILTQLMVDDTNNVYVAGWETASFTTNYNMQVLKYDSAGNAVYDFIWSDPGGIAPDYGKKLAMDSTGNLYLMGDASDHCFGNTFFNGFRWNIQINKYGYSTGVAVQEIANDNKQPLLLYPNPAKDLLNVKFSRDIFRPGNVQCTLYDINGRIIMSLQSNGLNDLMINTSGMTDGIYLVVAKQGEIRETGKVIIRNN